MAFLLWKFKKRKSWDGLIPPSKESYQMSKNSFLRIHSELEQAKGSEPLKLKKNVDDGGGDDKKHEM